jgi:cysteine desulfurase/selenocysteine lyase
MGIENIRRKNMQVSEVIREGVARLPGSKIFSPEDGHRRSSILTFSTSVESSIVVRKLEEYGIVVAERDIGGGKKGVRASPHFFNSEEEASILVSHLKSISA